MFLSYSNQLLARMHQYKGRLSDLDSWNLALNFPEGWSEVDSRSLNYARRRAPPMADPDPLDATATNSQPFNHRRRPSTKHYSVTRLLSVTEEA